MWRLFPLFGALVLVLFSTPAAAEAQVKPGDFSCEPCGEQCERMGYATGDRICTPPIAPNDRFDRHFGISVFGLGTPVVIDDGMPIMSRGQVATDHRHRVISTGDVRRYRIHHGPPATHPGEAFDADGKRVLRVHGGATPASDAGEFVDTDEGRVLRVHGDDPAPTAGTVETGEDGERILRLHEDEADDEDTAPQAQPDEPVDQQDEEEPVEQEPPEFATGYVDWEFVPGITIVTAEGPVSDVDAQRTVEADEQAVSNCFEPTAYPGGGAVEVEAHLAYNGAVQGVNGSADGMQPNQARCILQRAWRYDFPRLADAADEPGRVHYRVEFYPRRVDAPEVDPDKGQLFVERVRLADHPDLQSDAARQFVDRLDAAEQCAVDGLDALPTDLVATEVHGRWHRVGDGDFALRDVDITVTNKTSSEMPSGDVVDCWRRTLRGWDLQFDADDLPDELTGSFYVTVRPPGWHGM